MTSRRRGAKRDLVVVVGARPNFVKAAPLVRRFAVVPVRTIYGSGSSHYRPFHDTWVTSWLTVWYKTLGAEDS